MQALSGALQTLSDLFWQHPAAQLIGIIALIIGGSAFVQKNDQLLRRNLTLYTLLMGLHFSLLDMWTGALSAWLGTLRTYLSMHTRNIWVMCSFLLVYWSITLSTASHYADFLAILGTTSGTWAMFRAKGIAMRGFMLIGTLFWLAHNLIVGSIGGSLIEAFFLGINGRTMLQILKQGKQAAALAD